MRTPEVRLHRDLLVLSRKGASEREVRIPYVWPVACLERPSHPDRRPTTADPSLRETLRAPARRPSVLCVLRCEMQAPTTPSRR